MRKYVLQGASSSRTIILTFNTSTVQLVQYNWYSTTEQISKLFDYLLQLLVAMLLEGGAVSRYHVTSTNVPIVLCND